MTSRSSAICRTSRRASGGTWSTRTRDAAARRERDRAPRQHRRRVRDRAGVLVAHEREHHARRRHPERERQRVVGQPVEPPCEHGRDGPAREPPGQADAGQAGRPRSPPASCYEPKWDGFRSIVFRDGDEVEIGSRNERPMTRYFPEVVAAVLRHFPPRAVIDGEIVVAGDGGLDFWALQQRIHPADSRVERLAAETPASFVAFDLLALGDEDLTREPFESAPRRGSSRRWPARSRRSTSRRSRATRRSRSEWFERFEGAGLDGVIAKRPDLAYQPDKRVMSKIKHVRTADCVLAGYRVHKAGREAIGSLLLGLHDRRRGAALAVGRPRDRPGPGRRHRRLPDGAPPRALRRAAVARRRHRRPSVELGGGVLRRAARAAAAGTPARTSRSCRCGPSGWSRSATTTWRAPASGTRRSSSAGARTATRGPAATRSWTGRRRFDLADVLAGRFAS